MSATEFWSDVLEADETLLWSGRPSPRLHWRNWRLYGPAPMAATGLMVAAWFIISTTGSEGDMWLLILPALLVLIPVRTTWQHLRVYSDTRYALTTKRALFFRIEGDRTRVKAHATTAMMPPQTRLTTPPSVYFLRYGKKQTDVLGFEFIERHDALLAHLQKVV